MKLTMMFMLPLQNIMKLTIVDGDYEVITLKVETDDNGDEYLVEIEDEMEYEQISDILMQKIEEKFDVEYFEPEQ